MRVVLPAGRGASLAPNLIGIARRALYAGLVVALVGLAALLATAALPRVLGFPTLVVTGGSMGESIPNGSLVVARWLRSNEVMVGDVILAKEETADSHSRPKLHRVVSIQQDGDQMLVRTKGDANKAEDPLPYALGDRVLTPAYDIPYLGFLIAAAASPLGWLLMIALPGTVLCLLVLRSIWFPGRDRSLSAAL